MTNEIKFTMKEMRENLMLIAGEALARLAKASVTNVMARPVRMKDWLGKGEELIPTKLDYIADDDYLFARITTKGNYELTYVATDGLTFSVADDDYYRLINRFLDYFIRIYKA